MPKNIDKNEENYDEIIEIIEPNMEPEKPPKILKEEIKKPEIKTSETIKINKKPIIDEIEERYESELIENIDEFLYIFI